MAAALLKHYAQEAGIEVRTASAGLGAFTGDSASEHALKAMSELGLDLSGHRFGSSIRHWPRSLT